ncbi:MULTISPECIES: hypothetical protein [unclassified Microbacterium]|uniref:hypothetical protein n=1 Tax=unclassified Microbacterium TaxID=2609290 RepID=UPI0012FAD616|nr:hypothetical protein [Microbacterium sp. MAH-37]MVQ42884.1 hypothetical protein [Microbacterium sp. MAH-37]
MSRASRAAARDSRSGAGPTVAGAEPGPNPGATAKFGLFGEVLAVGLLITAASVAVITLPIALAAGVRHLRRFVSAEDSRAGLFWADVRRGILPSLPLGIGAVLLAAVLLIDIDLAGSGALPGGPVVAAVGWAGLAALVTGILLVAGAWEPDAGWRAALRAVPARAAADPAGTAYLLATGVFVGVVTWMLVPLFIPAIGCAALAVVAIPARRRRTA